MSVNYHALRPLGVTFSTPVSLDLSGRRLDDALDAIIAAIGPRPKALAFECSDIVLWLTTRDELDQMQTRAYDVRDLLLTMPLRKRPSSPVEQKTAEDRILQDLQSVARPISQQGRTASPRILSGQLIVTHTAAGQWETLRFLEQMERRRAWQFFGWRAGTLVVAALLLAIPMLLWTRGGAGSGTGSAEGAATTCAPRRRAAPSAARP
jgi:hypothetical protein